MIINVLKIPKGIRLLIVIHDYLQKVVSYYG